MQERGWRERVLGTAPLVALEAGSGLGWERWIGAEGLFIDTSDKEGTAAAAAQHKQVTIGQRAAEAIQRHLGARETD
jgi:transketolase